MIINGGSYYPQSQGRVESFNQTIETQLGKHLQGSHKWVQALPAIIQTYNITVHSVTNRSTFHAFFGRKPVNLYHMPQVPSKGN